MGQACESAAARQVARHMGLAESTVRAIDLRYLERWEARRRQPPLRQMGVDEIYRGKKDKFLTVVCNLETGEPLWFGKERKKETLDEFFRSQLVSRQRKRIEAACVDMWEPFRLSLEQWAPQCRIIYDKFHIMQHANDAVDEVRRAEFFRQGPKKRGLIKGKKWLLLSRWKNLTHAHRGELNRLFELNRRVFKAYLLKESLERLWDYRYEGAMLNYLQKWMDQLQVAAAGLFEKLAAMLLKHLDGIAELLPDQGALWSGRGRQRKHSHVDQPRPRLQEPPLSALEGQADGRDQRRIHRSSQHEESRVKWPPSYEFSLRAGF